MNNLWKERRRGTRWRGWKWDFHVWTSTEFFFSKISLSSIWKCNHWISDLYKQLTQWYFCIQNPKRQIWIAEKSLFMHYKFPSLEFWISCKMLKPTRFCWVCFIRRNDFLENIYEIKLHRNAFGEFSEVLNVNYLNNIIYVYTNLYSNIQ